MELLVAVTQETQEIAVIQETLVVAVTAVLAVTLADTLVDTKTALVAATLVVVMVTVAAVVTAVILVVVLDPTQDVETILRWVASAETVDPLVVLVTAVAVDLVPVDTAVLAETDTMVEMATQVT